MAISINWPTGVISIPQGDLTFVSGTLYELDVNELRLALKDLEDSEAGMPWPTTHNHNAPVTLSGVTYARALEIINGYTVTFEDTGSPYTVRCVSANHNLADVTNYTSEVSLIIGNAAGLIVGAGADPADIWDEVLESGYSAREIMRLLIAAVGNSALGLNGASPVFKSIDGAKSRITATQTDSERTVTGRDVT